MIRLYPPAKINFGLRVLGKRPDGFHELSSLMAPLPGLHDIMDIEEGGEGGLSLRCDAIKGGNILEKTYALFAENQNFYPSLKIQLIKRIPIGAGLGGGSSDAACLLKFLNNLSPRPMPRRRLIETALKIGADVPFFLDSRPALARGAGEKLIPLEGALPRLHLVLVWPELCVSTALAFSAYDKEVLSRSRAEKNLTKAAGNTKELFLSHMSPPSVLCLKNDLQNPVFKIYPCLAALQDEVLSAGAVLSGMSGSGSAIYGVFSSPAKAAAAAGSLGKKYKFVYLLSA